MVSPDDESLNCIHLYLFTWHLARLEEQIMRGGYLLDSPGRNT